jgi:hypothetical protein
MLGQPLANLRALAIRANGTCLFNDEPNKTIDSVTWADGGRPTHGPFSPESVQRITSTQGAIYWIASSVDDNVQSIYQCLDDADCSTTASSYYTRALGGGLLDLAPTPDRVFVAVAPLGTVLVFDTDADPNKLDAVPVPRLPKVRPPSVAYRDGTVFFAVDTGAGGDTGDAGDAGDADEGGGIGTYIDGSAPVYFPQVTYAEALLSTPAGVAYIDQSRRVVLLRDDGGTITLGGDGVTALANDEAYVYYAAGRQVFRIPLTGGTPALVAGGFTHVLAIGVAASGVYGIDETTPAGDANADSQAYLFFVAKP